MSKKDKDKSTGKKKNKFLKRKHKSDGPRLEEPAYSTDSGPVDPAEAIAKRGAHMLAKPERHFTVGTLEEAMLKRFPTADAEPWDRTGLTVGERDLPVSMVAVALDPTVSAIETAASLGADVLITHHPLFLEAPDTFAPAKSAAEADGAGVWAAIRNKVATMDFHTALDVSRAAQMVLPNMLGLTYKNQVVVPIASSKQKGYGQFCKIPQTDGSSITLAQLAARCVSVFGRTPRVWGSPDTPLKTAVTATGSAGNVAKEALLMGADVLICGEVKYHSALELKDAGMCIIELGHDVSELPLTAVIANALTDAGMSPDWISIIDQSNNWTTPESIRL